MNYSPIARIFNAFLLLALILIPAVSATSDPTNMTGQLPVQQDPVTGIATANQTALNGTVNGNLTQYSGITPTPTYLNSTILPDTTGSYPVPEVTPTGGKAVNLTAVNGTVRNAPGKPDTINTLTTTPVAKIPTTSPQFQNGTKKWASKSIGIPAENKTPALIALDQMKRSPAATTANTQQSILNMQETSGSSWTQVPPFPDFSRRTYPSTIIFNNKMWVIGGEDTGERTNKNDVWSSSDGINWIQVTDSAAFSPRFGHTSVVFNNKMWIIGGCDDIEGYKNDVWSSSDGVTWTKATDSTGFTPRYMLASVVFDNKMWVIGGMSSSGDKNDVWYSVDGTNWIEANTSAAFGPRSSFSTTVFNNRMWVIGGLMGSLKNDVWSSSDGVNWLQVTDSAAFSPRYDFTSVVFNSRVWVIGGCDDGGGYRNDVWSSPDGIVWTRSTESAAFSSRWGLTSVAFNNKIWVIGGYTEFYKNDIWSSSDGVTWTEPPGPFIFSPRYGHSSVVFNNKIWVIGGEDHYDGLKNDVWYSTDGVTWTPATESAAFSRRGDFTTVAFNSRMWVIGGCDDGGYHNDVWSSPDGIVWTRSTESAAFSPRRSHTSVEFNNRMWVIGGEDGSIINDVWYSVDGTNWIEANTSAAFGPRSRFSTTVFNNKIWVIGGLSGSTKNDVWSSADGANWTQVTNSAAFSPRFYHRVIVSDNKMWLIGGYDDEYGYMNDVWSSYDGVSWAEETTNAGFPLREGFTAAAFKDKLLVIGGINAVHRIKWYNDIWYHEVPPTQQLIVDIRDTSTGSFIPNATVGLFDPNHIEWQNTTTPTGTFVFTDAGATHQYPLVIGTNYRVAASADGDVPVVRNVTFTVSGQRETVEMGKVPVVWTYSITVVENPKYNTLVDPIAGFYPGSANAANVSKWLKQYGWEEKFYHLDETVTKEDFGINGGGLTDATFHYHFGHGNISQAVTLFYYYPFENPDPASPLNIRQSVTAYDVNKKWNKNIKWVMIDACEILNDDRWGQALGTSHAILGFQGEHRPSKDLPNLFFKYALEENRSIYNAYSNATLGSFTKNVSAAVIFDDPYQIYHDHFPNHGEVAPDESPDDDIRWYLNWSCGFGRTDDKNYT